NEKTAIFLEYRPLLFSIAYNMLGSIDAAEDMVQESYMNWTKVKMEEIRQIKAYLVKIITNNCINQLNRSKIQREQYIGVWLPEPVLNYRSDEMRSGIDSYHAVSIGILVLLEKLTPQERAIFLLREIFSYDYFELAEIFEKSEDNCRQIFKRAKDNLGNDKKRFTVDIEVHEKILQTFIKACSEGDMENLIGLLKEDILLLADGGGNSIAVNGQRLTAALNPISGVDNVARFLVRVTVKIYEHIAGLKQKIVIANGLPSLISYDGDRPLALISLDSDGEKIRNIYIQSNPDKLKKFVEE
ncbi:MAG TPA: sigma-70 family RNA polymerase sigma factor, partial [Puia sp.]|nr:sigma-70 family RNA polymerase sigma factor [Puia sp.]